MKNFVKKVLLMSVITVSLLIFSAHILPAVILASTDEASESVQAESSEAGHSQEAPAEDPIVKFAREYLGCKYVWGGSGPDVFDCSGFTMYVFSNFGVELPHSASSQALYGTTVSKEDLKPGNLVFFATSKRKRITHVGMYIGNGNFIHAASKNVTINNLSEAYYESRYMTAVRILTQEDSTQ